MISIQIVVMVTDVTVENVSKLTSKALVPKQLNLQDQLIPELAANIKLISVHHL